MNKRFDWRYWPLILILLLVAVEIVGSWWQFQEPLVVVVNRSGQDISKLHVSISGKDYEEDRLPNGKSLSFKAYPRGEGSIGLFFITSDTKSVKWEEAYIESLGGYEAEVISGPHGQIAVNGRYRFGYILVPAWARFQRWRASKY